MLAFKSIDIKLDIMSDGVSGRQILVFDHYSARRTVKLYETAIFRVRTKTVSLPLDQGGVYLLQGTLGHQTTLLVVFPGAYQ